MSIDLSTTVAAKSDQLNSDDLVGGPMTGRVISVTSGSTTEQPVSILLDCWPQPYKPCKTMRRLLLAAWGKETSTFIGRSITVYRDPSVKWGGDTVGGIRINALSHIERPLEISLTDTRKSKKRHVVAVLKATQQASPPSPLQASFEQMKSSWKSTREQRGQPATADDFRAFVSESTSGRVGMADAMIVAKYQQADIDACTDAVVALRESL